MGEEKLRVAPSPHHTKDMMDTFVDALKTVWAEAGLEFTDKMLCPETCTFCQKPLLFDQMESRVNNRGCRVPYCPVVAA